MPSSCPTARIKRSVQRPKPRQKNPSPWPNFRDHRRCVDDPLLAVLCRLQRAHGWSWASEASLAKMICEDTGHMPGEDTIRRALERLEALGLLYQVWLVKGGVLPDGRVATAGTRLIRVALSRGERHGFLARAAARARRPKGERREKSTGRVNHAAMFELMTAQPTAKPAAAPDTLAQALERRRAGMRALSLFDRESGQPPAS